MGFISQKPWKLAKQWFQGRTNKLKTNNFGYQNQLEAGIGPCMADNPLGLIPSPNAGRPAPGPVVQIPAYAVWVYAKT